MVMRATVVAISTVQLLLVLSKVMESVSAGTPDGLQFPATDQLPGPTQVRGVPKTQFVLLNKFSDAAAVNVFPEAFESLTLTAVMSWVPVTFRKCCCPLGEDL